MWLLLLSACNVGTLPRGNVTTALDGFLTEFEACDDLTIAIRDPDHIVRLGLATPTDEGGEALVAAAAAGPVSADFALPDPTLTARLFFGTDLAGCVAGTDVDVDVESVPISGALRIDIDGGLVEVTLDDAVFQVVGRTDAGPTLDHGEWRGTLAE